MKARPILFSAPMVQSLLAGTKFQTRRIMRPQPAFNQLHEHKGKVIYDGESRMWCWKDLVLDNIWDFPDGEDRKTLAERCPYGKPGDLLWVRETHAIIQITGAPAAVYAATDQRSWKYKPSIHMPRWASRLTLEITDVRVQRLQEISEQDAKAEGVTDHGGRPPMGHFNWAGSYVFGFGVLYRGLWESINGPGSWDANAWVWCLSFRVHQQNVDAFLKSREAA